MKAENEVLDEFYLLSEYLKKVGKIHDLNKYKTNFSAFLSHADHIKAYDFIAPICEGKKVLDIGCFIGYGASRISPQAKQIVAIDVDDNALEFARKNRVAPNVLFEKADTRSLPFPDEAFDVVIAFQLIEHIPPKEIRGLLSEIRRVLKSNGLLFITTPNRKFRLMPFQPPSNPEHYQEFNAKALLRTLKNVFPNVQIKGIRAKDWIEELEKRRIRKPPHRVFIHDPFYRIINTFLPSAFKPPLKKIKNYVTRLLPSEQENDSDKNSKFDILFREFSMDDFYLENHDLDKSIDLFCTCVK